MDRDDQAPRRTNVEFTECEVADCQGRERLRAIMHAQRKDSQYADATRLFPIGDRECHHPRDSSGTSCSEGGSAGAEWWTSTRGRLRA